MLSGIVAGVGRRVLWLLLVLVAVAAVVVLRDQTPPVQQLVPAAEPPTTAPPTNPPVLPRATLQQALDWREVPLPADWQAGTEPAADGEHQVVRIVGGDGHSRVVAPGGNVHDLPPGVSRTRLVGHHLVVQQTLGVSKVSALDLTTGLWRTAPDSLSARPFAASNGYVVVPADERCLVIHELTTLAPLARHCADPGWFVSQLTDERSGPQWRERSSGRRCTRWLTLDNGVPRALDVGVAACRAAVLVNVDGWQLTANLRPYDSGSPVLGPLVAVRGDHRLTLDHTTLQPQVCGAHVYWLTRARPTDHRGSLARWTPGTNWIEILTPGDDERLRTDVSPPRCVNGVLNVLTTAAGSTRLWLLPGP